MESYPYPVKEGFSGPGSAIGSMHVFVYLANKISFDRDIQHGGSPGPIYS